MPRQARKPCSGWGLAFMIASIRAMVGLRRKGFERRPIDLCKQLVAADAELAHDLGVEVRDSLADRGIELIKREEAAVAQPGQHKALDNLHRHFDLGFVAW